MYFVNPAGRQRGPEGPPRIELAADHRLVQRQAPSSNNTLSTVCARGAPHPRRLPVRCSEIFTVSVVRRIAWVCDGRWRAQVGRLDERRRRQNYQRWRCCEARSPRSGSAGKLSIRDRGCLPYYIMFWPPVSDWPLGQCGVGARRRATWHDSTGCRSCHVCPAQQQLPQNDWKIKSTGAIVKNFYWSLLNRLSSKSHFCSEVGSLFFLKPLSRFSIAISMLLDFLSAFFAFFAIWSASFSFPAISLARRDTTSRRLWTSC